MSIGFHWFKDYEIETFNENFIQFYSVIYKNGGGTSHSAYNVITLQNLFEKYGGFRIPQIEQFPNDDRRIELIPPKRVSEICSVILESGEGEIGDMRERIEWLKRLSDDGYYLTYDLPY